MKTGVKFLKNLPVEPLWNTAPANQMLERLKKVFQGAAVPFIFRTSPRCAAHGSGTMEGEKTNFQKD